MYTHTLMNGQNKTSVWLSYGEYNRWTRDDLWDSGFKELRSESKSFPPPCQSSTLCTLGQSDDVEVRGEECWDQWVGKWTEIGQ